MDVNNVRNVVLERLQGHVDRIAKGHADDIDVLPAVFYEVLSGEDQIKVDLLAAKKQQNELYDVTTQIRTELGQVEANNRLRAKTNKKLLLTTLALTLFNSAFLVWLLVK